MRFVTPDVSAAHDVRLGCVLGIPNGSVVVVVMMMMMMMMMIITTTTITPKPPAATPTPSHLNGVM